MRTSSFVAFVALGLAACSRSPRSVPQTAPSAPTSTLHGRVLDEAGNPLASVRVRLRPTGADWSSTSVAEDAFERATGADGRFRFDVPVPEAPNAWIEIEPDVHRARAALPLGADAAPTDPRLHPGTNTLADVRLAAAGALRGRVLGPDGAPLGGAWVRADRSTFTAADGRFELGHLEPGPASLTVSATGCLERTVDALVVHAGRTDVIADVRLERRRAISGTVEDRDGRPLAGIVVTARDRDDQTARRGTSAADGRFSIALAANAPHVLSVDEQGGFLAWGALDERAADLAAGVSNVRVVLDRARAVELAVVDAETGAPLADYAIDVREDAACGWRASGSASWQKVPPDGVTKMLVGSAPATVVVRAPDERRYVEPRFVGYLPFRGPLALDAGSTQRATIHLERGGTIRLRPTPPTLSFSAIVVARRSGSPEDAGPEFRAVPTANLDGGSEFDMAILGLPTGTYDIAMVQKGRARPLVREVEIAAGETVDLGTIAILTGAIAVVRVVAPEGVSPLGLQLRIDEEAPETIVSKQGRRIFAELAPGEHAVTLLAVPPHVPVERTLRFTLLPGEVRELRFDLREP